MGWYFFLRLNITLIGRVAIRLLLAFLMSGKGCTAPVKKKSETPLKSELSLTKVCTAARTVPVIFWTRTPLSGWLCPVFKRYHGRRLTVNDTQCVNERKVCARERTVVRSKGKHFLKAAYERRERRPGVLSVKLKTNTNKNASTPIVCCCFQISSIHDYFVYIYIYIYITLTTASRSLLYLLLWKYRRGSVWAISAHVRILTWMEYFTISTHCATRLIFADVPRHGKPPFEFEHFFASALYETTKSVLHIYYTDGAKWCNNRESKHRLGSFRWRCRRHWQTLGNRDRKKIIRQKATRAWPVFFHARIFSVPAVNSPFMPC